MDDRNNAGTQYRDLINTGENYELEYWSNKFDVSVEVLKSAVKAVGSSAKAVEAYLTSH